MLHEKCWISGLFPNEWLSGQCMCLWLTCAVRWLARVSREAHEPELERRRLLYGWFWAACMCAGFTCPVRWVPADSAKRVEDGWLYRSVSDTQFVSWCLVGPKLGPSAALQQHSYYSREWSLPNERPDLLFYSYSIPILSLLFMLSLLFFKLSFIYIPILFESICTFACTGCIQFHQHHF